MNEKRLHTHTVNFFFHEITKLYSSSLWVFAKKVIIVTNHFIILMRLENIIVVIYIIKHSRIKT